ncbi:glutamate--cysteine ligase [Myxococcota bacterium]|nr:glutamate--cysteine ligase [Myxococcota bacterium]
MRTLVALPEAKMKGGTPDLDAPIASPEDLVAYLRSGEKPPEQWRVGTEHEKIGLAEATHDPVPFEGGAGIAAVLEGIANEGDWVRVREGENVIALEKDAASITLEPGGQLELSGAPLRTIFETCDELHEHLALTQRVSESLGIIWLGIGMNPLHPVAELPAMPKARYRIMRTYLPQRGKLGLEMMFATATVQANYDFSSESDMVEKMRVATAVSPVISAIYANAPVSTGQPNGFVSRRQETWRDTDPDRTGLLEMVFEPDFGYRRYVEWVLDVPMFFTVRGDTYQPAGGRTFRQWLEEPGELGPPRLVDFERHLTTVFPEIRLKRFIEVRGADAVSAPMTCALPALWKGILYDGEARRSAWELLSGVAFASLEQSRVDVARRGLGATFGSRPVLELARELTEVARGGLRRIGHSGNHESDESCFLEPIDQQLLLGKSPGEVILEEWHGAWGGAVDRLIDHVRY